MKSSEKKDLIFAVIDGLTQNLELRTQLKTAIVIYGYTCRIEGLDGQAMDTQTYTPLAVQMLEGGL